MRPGSFVCVVSFFAWILSACDDAGPVGISPGTSASARAEQTAAAGMTKYNYQCADGGPHIVLPDALRGAWSGGILPTGGDYGRACAVTGDFGLIPVGEGQGLVLAGSPAMVALARSPDGNGADVFILQSWADMNLDGLVDRSLAAIPTEKMTPTGQTWQVDGGGLTAIFAADSPGDTAYGELRLSLPAGRYTLLKGHYNPKPNEEVVICRMVTQPLASTSSVTSRTTNH